MRPAAWMAGGSVGTSVLASAVTGPGWAPELLGGMLAPLVVSVVTWELVERTYRRDPERLTGLMVAAFAGKMIFFGAYVTLMLLVLALRPVPFTISFTAYFIGLHLTEALLLRRLFSEGATGAR